MTTSPTQSPSVEHLEMIQHNIDRMNRCSFECKKWSVGLAAAVLTAAAGTKPWLGYFSVVPTLVFGFLDAYYLWVERGFRNLYEAVRKGEDTEPFIMNPMKHLYPDREQRDQFEAVLFSKTVIWVHLIALAGSVFVSWVASAE